MLKAVVVGCGNVGLKFEFDPLRPKPASHVGAYLANHDTGLICAVDTNIKNIGGDLKLLSGVKRYGSLEKCLIENAPDIVSVATPLQTHLEIIKLLLKYKVPAIICEKPLAGNLADAKKIVDLLDKNKVIFLVNYQRRFLEPYVNAKRKIKEGVLGDVKQANVIYTNGIYNNGSHAIDALRFLLDDEVDWVTGWENESIAKLGSDYNIDGFIHFKKEILVSIQTLNDAAYAIHDIKIYGEKGALFINRFGYRFQWIKARNSDVFSGMLELNADKGQMIKQKLSATSGVITKAVELIKNGRIDKSMASDSLSNIKIINAMVESSKNDSRKYKVDNK